MAKAIQMWAAENGAIFGTQEEALVQDQIEGLKADLEKLDANWNGKSPLSVLTFLLKTYDITANPTKVAAKAAKP